METEEMLELTLGAGRDAPARARTALRGLNGSLEDLRHAVRLLVSELVTNAVQHGGPGGSVQVRLEALCDRVRVEVRDQGPGFRPRTGGAPDPLRGFGLRLVDELTDRWGVEPDDGALVWFEIDRSRPRG
jgi:anti-sigma regulatory factor (Ser/Thr protein kinase)